MTQREEKSLVVEGTGILRAEMLTNYDVTVFVCSDVASEWAAIEKRESGNLELWRSMYMPSVDIWYGAEPWKSAQLQFQGRMG